METTIETTERSKKRQAQLFGLGLAKTGFGFTFKGYYVSAYSIENMKDAEWEQYIESITDHMTNVRGQHEYSDKEKALVFVDILKKMEPPHYFNEGRIKDIMEGAIYSIQELANYLEEEVESCQQ